MNAIPSSDLQDPDLFSSDVHYCLLTQGLRSRRLRELMRLARNNSELERIFEIKVAEFRRYLRETRVPTLWNLPIRSWEWLSANAQFTPPREVMTTLAYVAVMLVALDAMKSRIPWAQWTQLAGGHESTLQRPTYEMDSDLLRSSNLVESQTSSKVDEWFAAELKRAAESAELSKLLAQQLSEGLDKLPIEEMVSRKIELAVSSTGPRSNGEESRAEIQEAMQKWFASDEFRATITAAVHKAIESERSPLSDSKSVTTDVVSGATP